MQQLFPEPTPVMELWTHNEKFEFELEKGSPLGRGEGVGGDIGGNISDMETVYEIKPFSVTTSSTPSPKSLEDQTQFIGWSLMPALFRAWDLDNSDSIDREELLYGVNEYCKLKGITVFSEDACIELMNEVDINQDNELDSREFGFFLSKFSRIVQANLDDVVYFMLETLEAKKLEDLKKKRQEQERQQQSGSFIGMSSGNYLYLVTDIMHRAFKSPSAVSSTSITMASTTSANTVPNDIKVFDNDSNDADLILEDFNVKRRVSKQERRQQFQRKVESFSL